MQRLYDYGARKFVIVGIALIGCTPSERNERSDQECKADVNQLSAKYNKVLISMLKKLKSELKGINYSYFDGYSVMHNFIQNPTAYGNWNSIKYFPSCARYIKFNWLDKVFLPDQMMYCQIRIRIKINSSKRKISYCLNQ